MLATNQTNRTGNISLPKFIEINRNMSAALFAFCGLGHLILSSIVVAKSSSLKNSGPVVPVIDFVICSFTILIGLACLYGTVKKKIFASAFLGTASLIFATIYLCYSILIFSEGWFYFGMRPSSAGICALVGTLLMIYSFIANMIILNHGSSQEAVEEFLMKH